MRKIFLTLPFIAPMLAIMASALGSCSIPSGEKHETHETTTSDTTMELESDGLLWIITLRANGDTLSAQSFIMDTAEHITLPYSALEYLYNDLGQPESRNLYMVDPADLKLKPVETTYMEYDSIGNITQTLQKTFNHENGTFENSSCRMYAYNDTTMIFQSSYIWQTDKEKWLELSARYYEYDSLGHLLRSLIEERDPNDTSKVIKKLVE